MIGQKLKSKLFGVKKCKPFMLKSKPLGWKNKSL
jgi:hypothetical protein